MPMESLFPSLNDALIPYFKYRTAKYILIEVPIVGIVHRLCQGAALFYVVANMYYGNGWAMATVPMGSVNAWAEVGGYMQAAQSTDPFSSVSYCSNPEHAYDYGGEWQYGTKETPPVCNSPNHYTVTEKSVDSVFFTTAYIERAEYGFPCSEYEAASGAAEGPAAHCASRLGGNATLEQYANGQCVCTGPSATYYPLHMESMELAFEHFFHTPEEIKVGGASLKGESGNRDAALPLHTTLVGANGTTWEWQAGSPITLPLSSLLLAAHHQICNQDSAADLRDGRADGACRTGIRLDEPNVDLQPDVANASRYPAFRTSGVSLSLEISYTNANDEKLAELNRKSVRATVKASVQTGAFSSVGGSTTFSTYPSGSIGAETWELASRYKQGIMVHLTSSGVIYTFDPFYFVNVMVAGLVLLGLASTVADLFAFWCLGGGQSTVLRNKRCEKVSKRSEFAETGLKAVIAAHQFQFLDHDRNGVIEAVDLVRALAGVETADGSGPAITAGQAHAIATAIMADADVDAPTASMSSSKSVGSLDFSEFMTCIDGDGASFQFLLKKLKMQERAVHLLESQPDFADCLTAFNTAREQTEAKALTSDNKRQRFALRFPDMAAQMPRQVAAQMRAAPRLGLTGFMGGRGEASDKGVQLADEVQKPKEEGAGPPLHQV